MRTLWCIVIVDLTLGVGRVGPVYYCKSVKQYIVTESSIEAKVEKMLKELSRVFTSTYNVHKRSDANKAFA